MRRARAAVLALSVAAISGLLPAGAWAQDTPELPGAILGQWDTGDGAHVEMYERDGLYHGKFIHFYDEPPADGVDAKNPDPELQGRPLIGADFILNFRFDGKKWRDGRIYNPENGKQYKADLELKDGVLKVRGWLGIRLLGRTVEWTPLEEADGAGGGGG